jgi:uncharacterized ion transporter superfamily protein YfcC
MVASEADRRRKVSIMVQFDKEEVAPPEAHSDSATGESRLRARALKRLKKRRDFAAHLVVYALVNTVIVVVWAVTSRGFFWPVFPMAIWGIGIVMNAWDVWRGDEFTENQIAREVERIKDRDAGAAHG